MNGRNDFRREPIEYYDEKKEPLARNDSSKGDIMPFINYQVIST